MHHDLKRLVWLTALAVSLLALTAAAATKERAAGQEVRRDIEALITHCQADDIAKAAGYVAYRGSDTARRWRDLSDPSRTEDRVRVESACRQIKGLLEGSTGRDYVEYQTERESEGTWHIWKVRVQGPSPREAMFAMLHIKGRYALGDLD